MCSCVPACASLGRVCHEYVACFKSMQTRRSTNPTNQSTGDETARIDVKERGSNASLLTLHFEERTRSLNIQMGNSVQADSNDGQMLT